MVMIEKNILQKRRQEKTFVLIFKGNWDCTAF